MENESLYQDSLFRRIVVTSTGLGLACMLGSVAAIQIGKGTGLQFRWHWTILVFAAAVVIWNSRFWKVLWELQESPTRKARRKLGLHLAILLLLGAGSFVYPVRFVEQSYWNGIARGLVTAVTFLGTMLWLIYKCGKGLTEIDSVELDRQGQGSAS
jgi:hypothetical protein